MKTCATRRSLRGASAEISPRSNNSARRSKTRSTNKPGSPNGSLNSCGSKYFAIGSADYARGTGQQGRLLAPRSIFSCMVYHIGPGQPGDRAREIDASRVPGSRGARPDRRLTGSVFKPPPATGLPRPTYAFSVATLIQDNDPIRLAGVVSPVRYDQAQMR